MSDPFEYQFGSDFGFSDTDPYRITSPFTESEFSRSGRDIEDLYFPSSDVCDINDTRILSENNVSPTLVKDMTAFFDANENGLLDPGERTLFTYKIKVFVSKDASYLEKAFEACEPLDNEVCFFLEDNSTDIFSARTALIKIGSDFRDDLRKRQTIAKIESRNENYYDYVIIGDEMEGYERIDFTSEELSELIQTGSISNTSMTLLIGLYQLLNIQNIVLAPAYSLIGTGLLWITEKAREYITFHSESWDPEASGSGENFRPILFSFQSDGLELGTRLLEKAVRQIKHGIDQKERRLRSRIGTIMNPGIPGFKLSPSLKSFLETCLHYAGQFKELIFAGIDKIVEVFSYLGQKWLNALNAFYCGLWNSVVEIVLGLIDMIGYIFKGLGFVGESMSNAQTLVPKLLERVDEFIQMVQEVNLFDTVSGIFSKLIEKVSSLNLSALTGMISIEKVGYFMGNVAGFIVELVIDAFISGGTKGVVDLFKKFGTIGKDVMETILAKMGRIFGAVGEFSVDTAFKFVEYVIDLLRKGKDAVLSWIDELFVVIEKAVKLGDEIIERILDLIDLSRSQLDTLRRAGFDFVSFAEEGAEFQCRLCKIVDPT